MSKNAKEESENSMEGATTTNSIGTFHNNSSHNSDKQLSVKPNYKQVNTLSINSTMDETADINQEAVDIDTDDNNDGVELPKYLQKNGTKHPYDKNWLISRIFQYVTHFWLYAIVKLGYKHDLEAHDCYDVPFKDSAEERRKLWNEYASLQKEQGKEFNTASMVWRIERRNIMERFIMATIAKLSGLSIPFLISTLTVYFEDETQPFIIGVYYSLLLFVAGIIYTVIFNFGFVSAGRAVTSVRSYLILMIYDKSLKMSLSATSPTTKNGGTATTSQTTMGQKLTMIAADTRSIAYFVGWAPIMLANAVLTVAVVIFLYLEVGPAAFAGWSFMVVIGGPCQYIVGKKIVRATRKYLAASDIRVKFITELIQGIRVTKMYSWEYPLMDKVGIYRDEEAKRLMIRVKYMALMTMMNIATPQFMALILFAVYIAVGNELTLAKTFTVISLIQQLRISIKIIPFAVMLGIGSHVGCKRLDALFMSTEQNTLQIKNKVNNEELKEDNDNIMISMKNASFKWNNTSNTDQKEPDDDDDDNNDEKKEDDNDNGAKSISKIELVINNKSNDDFMLKDITFQIKKGELVAIVGSVGSGKSSLIAAILGEIRMINGYYYKNDSNAIGYVSQQAFIINGTVRSNILFGLKYNKEFYETVIEAAALNHDLNILANGDLTEIGERGINLSGGQKSRISFARSLYRSGFSNNVNLYLFDDPLSAVDVDVGSTMFHDGICNVLNDKTRIIVMNSHLNLLKYCDRIIIMENGKIVCYESYENVMDNDKYSHLLPKDNKHSDNNDDEENALIRRKTKRNELKISKTASLKGMNYSYAPSKFAKDAKMAEEKAKKGKLTVAEDRSKTSVPLSVYGKYFSNAAQQFDFRNIKEETDNNNNNGGNSIGFGIFVIIFECLLLILAQTFDTTSDIWLSFWSEEKYENRFPNKTDEWWLFIWSIFTICLGITAFCSSALFGYLSIKSSMNLHCRTLWSVLRAPMLYFDSTPTGRILNRFSKDTNEMDDQLQINFNNFAQNALQIIGYLVLIIYAVPYILVILIIVIPLFYILQKYFRQTSRSIKRLEQITFTPIINQFSESLLGLDTIRSYKLSQSFFIKFKHFININHKAFLTENIAMFWFGSNINILVSLLLFCVALIACYLSKYGDKSTFDVSLLSLSLVYSYSLTTVLQWSMNSFIDVEKNFTAVERLLYYEANIDKESVTINYKYRPSIITTDKWPNKGQLKISNLSMRYRNDLDLVLNDINMIINPGERIGICGRTGSGKSSLLLTLFRLIEPEKPKSCIFIDDIDCLKLGLRDLRKNLSIIPQEPVLFSGTLRFNLDPFHQFKENEIWDVLKKIKLFHFINDKKDKLQYNVAENGSNFSAGQKQLICIGRALLKKTKILLLDEATSSIDKYTDKLIQDLIRKEFNDRTVLCIAHRLQTIIDYDRILVLQNGKIIEFDEPQKLLKNKNGIFTSMVAEKIDIHHNNKENNNNHNDVMEEENSMSN